jgi:uncharacterized membrane protein
MCGAGLAILAIGLPATNNEVARASGLDKIVALSNLCFAIPLAVFGAEHLSGAKSLAMGVPSYMPWPLFWAYFVGFALIAASLSIATRIQVRWSGLLFGIMMFVFLALIHIPRAYAHPHERIPLTIVFREMSFAGGGWALTGAAIGRDRASGKTLITVGRVLIAIAAIFFAIQHFLHPLGLPGVPLAKQMPTWIPARLGQFIGYVTGAFLLVGGASLLLNRKVRIAATNLGSWILLEVLLIYGPVLILALSDPSTAVQVEGINYFADTLLFSGAILALASAVPRRRGRTVDLVATPAAARLETDLPRISGAG